MDLTFPAEPPARLDQSVRPDPATPATPIDFVGASGPLALRSRTIHPARAPTPKPPHRRRHATCAMREPGIRGERCDSRRKPQCGTAFPLAICAIVAVSHQPSALSQKRPSFAGGRTKLCNLCHRSMRTVHSITILDPMRFAPYAILYALCPMGSAEFVHSVTIHHSTPKPPYAHTEPRTPSFTHEPSTLHREQGSPPRVLASQHI